MGANFRKGVLRFNSQPSGSDKMTFFGRDSTVSEAQESLQVFRNGRPEPHLTETSRL